jgi:hypothetical protein
MADLNQFQRSKDRLNEILYYLTHKQDIDEQTVSYIKILEMSIKTLDIKIEQFKISPEVQNSGMPAWVRQIKNLK